MNLLMFNYEYPPLGGGGGVIHQHVAEALAARHQVTVVTSGFGDLPARETVRGVEVLRVPVWGRRSQPTASLLSMLSYYPASLRAGRQLLSTRRFDLINTHFAVPSGPSAVRLARAASLPHVLSIHGGDIFDPSKRLSPHRHRPLRRVVQRVLRAVDAIVAPSRNTAENAERYYGFPAQAIEVIPHGLQRPTLEPVPRQELGFAPEHRVLVTVGRLVARKANDQLLRVVRTLNDARLRLVIIGEGPQRPALEALSRELGISSQVHFAGAVDEQQKFRLLQAADVFVSTTSHEGFGLMYVEALFCGLPIVTYDHGGQGDFLVDGRTGYQVPLGDLDRFAARVAELLADADLCARIRRHNLDYAGGFTIEHCARRYESVYARVVRAGARSA